MLFLGSSVFAQEAVTLDTALKNSAAELSDKLPQGTPERPTVVLVITHGSEYPKVNKYVLDELYKLYGNSKDFSLVDRQERDIIDKEVNDQLPRASEDTVVSPGKNWSAQYLVTVSFSPKGKQYCLTFRASDMEKGVVIYNPDILPVKRDKDLDDLLQDRLYLGARAGASLPSYTNGYGLVDAPVPAQRLRGSYGFDAGLYASASVWSLFEVQAEAIFTTDTFTLYSGNTPRVKVSYTSLMLPLLVKVVWRPSIFTVQGYAGAYISLPLGQLAVQESDGPYMANYTAPPGFVAGGSFGIKLGPGVLLADIRYAADFSNLSAQHNGTRDVSKRSKVVFSLGYEFGVIKK
jgi:hypothetical protein